MEANLRLVMDYFDLAFRRKRPREAAETYLAPDYTHHGEGCESGAEGFARFFEDFFRRHPGFEARVLRSVGDAETVALHVRTNEGDGVGKEREVAEFYRVHEGKIREHWHVLAAPSADSLKDASSSTLPR